MTFQVNVSIALRYTVPFQSINQSNFHSTNIPLEARLSGATAISVFNRQLTLCELRNTIFLKMLLVFWNREHMCVGKRPYASV